MARVAQITTVDMKRQQIMRVSLPEKIDEKDFGLIYKSVFERIKDLTGCACLSGVIDVILEERFQDIIEVPLTRG